MTAADAGRDPTTLHASAMVVDEVGILVRGPSGAGKSRLVMTLVEAARRDGRFAALVADDRTRVEPAGGRLVASPHPALAGRIERRGLGILSVASEPACVLGLVVDLVPGPVPRLPEAADREAEIAGVRLPRLALPAGIAAADAVSLVFTLLVQRVPLTKDRQPFFLPSPPRCTR